MRNFINRRVVPLFLVLLVCASLVVPVYADGFADTDSVAAWSVKFSNSNVNSTFLNAASNYYGTTVSVDTMWAIVNGAMDLTCGVGEVSLEKLNQGCAQLQFCFGGAMYDTVFRTMVMNTAALRNQAVFALMGLKIPSIEVRQHPSSGLLRLYDVANGLWIVNSSGQYPYCEGGSQAATSGGNKWVGEGTVTNNIGTSSVSMKDYTTLGALNALLIESGTNSQLKALGSKYYGIWYNRQYYCDSEGHPFVCWASEAQTAINQSRPDTTVKDETGAEVETPEGNTTNIDLSGMTITLPDGSINVIDNLIYDESTKTYSIDSHDTYNTTVNNYYSWTYHINYTSITYIGQTSEYNKYYEVYYQLPDGRDSADLTAEELEQLNLDIDVAPYSRTVDNVSLKSLYHFDGDTRDSSYWNYRTSFAWDKGASITYMDSGNFKGALYLDETDHAFTFTMPQYIGGVDFTMQFRLYQSHTFTPNTDSNIQIAGTTVLQFDGASIKDASGAVLSAMPIGSWNEIAIERSSGVFYFYLNGVPLSSASSPLFHGDDVKFTFGSGQQTFKYFDEFRFVTQALYFGAPYDCTSVPHDTNLTLVLPGSDSVYADEWFEWTGGEKALMTIDYTRHNSISGAELFHSNYVTDGVFGIDFQWTDQGLYMMRNSSSAGSFPAGIELYPNFSAFPSSGYYRIGVWGGSSYGDCGNSILAGYFFVDLANNKITFPENITGYEIDGIKFYTDRQRLMIAPTGDYGLISRVEILDYANSTYADFSVGKMHSSVTVADELIAPMLAVRTDITITDYQIGGPRPSLPTKGLVWALVEGGYITSLQIYNGQAWEGCNGRIWTGERWIPYSSYNVLTLKDMYDIVDASGNGYEYIYTQQGFWSWWQKSWNSFTERLFSGLGIPGTGPGGSSSTSGGLWARIKNAFNNTLGTLIEGLFTLMNTILEKLFGLMSDTLSFFFSFLSDAVVGGVSNLFGSFTDGGLWEGFQSSSTDEEGNVTTTWALPDGVSAAFVFISGVFLCFPAEIRTVFLFGLGVMFFFAIFKMVRS